MKYPVLIFKNYEPEKNLVNAKCPACRKCVAYFSDGKKKEHRCSICGKMVTL